ncbi:MAG: hypothetical protein L3K02_01775, partial [Thermoplasmata archaeon]|nr:hypothetical protein [Thermoplasmata archaeon]
MIGHSPPRATAGWIVVVLVVASSLAVLGPVGSTLARPNAPAQSIAAVPDPGALAFATESAPAGSSAGAIHDAGSHHPPGEITSGMGWEGIDYRNSCS